MRWPADEGLVRDFGGIGGHRIPTLPLGGVGGASPRIGAVRPDSTIEASRRKSLILDQLCDFPKMTTPARRYDIPATLL